MIMMPDPSWALPKFESYLAFETAAFFGLKAQAATVRFHGIGRLEHFPEKWTPVFRRKATTKGL
jgi:hypothetical protein